MTDCLASELCGYRNELLRMSYRCITAAQQRHGLRLIPQDAQTAQTFRRRRAREKLEQLERTVDDIRRRFGHYAIYRAVVEFDPTLKHINPKEDHTIHPIGYFKAM
jgi:DNA polymerase-4